MDVKDRFDIYRRIKVIWVDKVNKNEWSKEKAYLDCNEEEKKQFNLRKQFPNEIILDFEENERLISIKKELDDKDYKYHMYSTGSRGFHVHMYFDDLEKLDRKLRDEIRKSWIIQFKADLRMKSESHYVAVENKPHFKSGKVKSLIHSNPGNNSHKKDVVENAIKYINEQNIIKGNLTDSHFTNYSKKDKFFQYITKNIIPDGTDRNNTIFPNIAVALVKQGLTKTEIDKLLRNVIENKFPDKTYGEFEGWLNKAFNGDIDDYNTIQINTWIDKYIKDDSLKYNLTPIILKDKRIGSTSDKEIIQEILNDLVLQPDDRLHMFMYDYLEKLTKVEDSRLRKSMISYLAFKLRRPVYDLTKELRTVREELEDDKDDFFNANDLLKNKDCDTKYWIQDLIPKNAVMVFAGRQGEFKSFLCLDIILHAVNNKPFLNKFKVCHVPKVMYYDLENSINLTTKRMHFLLKGHKFESPNLTNLTFGKRFKLYNLRKEIERCKDYDIIVLDSYRRFIEGSEDKSENVNDFYKAFLDGLKNAGKTILVIHHFRKTSFERFDRDEIMLALRGSGDLGAQPEVVMGLKKVNESKSVDGNNEFFELIFREGKFRDDYTIPNFRMKIELDRKNKSTNVTYLNDNVTLNISPKIRRSELILEIIEDGLTMEAGEVYEEVNKRIETSRNTIQSDLKELRMQGKLVQDSKRCYKLSTNLDKYD